MPNQVTIFFVGQDQSFNTTKEQIIKGLGDVDRQAAQAGRSVDTALAFAKGQFLYDFFKRGASAAVEFGRDAVRAFNEAEAAAKGLQSVAAFRGVAPAQATGAVRNLDLVKNGLLSITDASTALKSLLQTNFTLEESIKLLKVFGDSAAFNRQASLSFGEAIVRTAEGIRLGNSQLSDGVGVAQNLGQMLKQAGVAEDQLGNIAASAAARQAIFNGFVREAAASTGDAAKLTNTFAGEQAKLDAAYSQLLVTVGQVITKNPELGKSMGELVESIVGLTKEIGTEGSGANKALNDLATFAGYAVKGLSNLIEVGKELAPVFDFIIQNQALFARLLGYGGFDSSGRIAATDALINRLQMALNDTPEAMNARVEQGASAGAKRILADTEASINASVEAQRKAEKAARERYAATEEKALREIAKLRISADDNPLVKLWDDATERQRQFQKEFAEMPGYIRRELDKVSQQAFAINFFKADLESVDRLAQLTQRVQQLTDGREYEEAERQRGSAYRQRQADLDSQIRELQTGRQLDPVEKAQEAVRGLVQSGLLGVELSKAIAQATEGLSIEQLQRGGLRYTRQDALVDIQRTERGAEAFRKAPPEVEQARKFITMAQQEFDQAKQNANFNQALGQDILDRKITAVLGRISPDKLSPDLRSLELDATKRQIEREAQMRADLQAKLEQFGISIETFKSASEQFGTSSASLKTTVEKGIDLRVTIKDDRTTSSVLGPGADSTLYPDAGPAPNPFDPMQGGW